MIPGRTPAGRLLSMSTESKPPSRSVSSDVVAPSQAPALLRQESVWNELAARMKRGDKGALAELYDQTGAVLYGMTIRMLGDEAEAQEVLLEAYSRAWSRIQTFDPARSALVAWLILLARGVALERPGRKPGPTQTAAGDRLVLERAFFDGVVEGDLRGALTRLRREKEGGK